MRKFARPRLVNISSLTISRHKGADALLGDAKRQAGEISDPHDNENTALRDEMKCLKTLLEGESQSEKIA